MAVRPREEILSAVRGLLGDRTDDEAVALLEDLSDTYADRQQTDGEDWKKKYEDNDAEWRKRYTDRFYGADNTCETILLPQEQAVQAPEELFTYEALFKEES